jgi:hypothetical protein
MTHTSTLLPPIVVQLPSGVYCAPFITGGQTTRYLSQRRHLRTMLARCAVYRWAVRSGMMALFALIRTILRHL